MATEQHKELFEVVGGFSDGSEDSDQDCASTDEECTSKRVAGKGFPEDQGSECCVEDETRLGLEVRAPHDTLERM